MKIYTKTGDKGTTALFGGKRVSKSDIRIEAYGTVDELNAYIGLIRFKEIDAHAIETLGEIQDRLFTLGSILASEPGKNNLKVPDLHESDVEFLENEIDKMNEILPELKAFVLPGGNDAIGFAHVARCVCRRAERDVVHLAQAEDVPDIAIKYLNRLSDYLFVLSRKLTYDANLSETPWNPRIP